MIIQVVETNEFMKRDLQEFSQAVQTDASKLVAVTATTMKEKLHINVSVHQFPQRHNITMLKS